MLGAIKDAFSGAQNGFIPSFLPFSGMVNDIVDNITGKSQKEFAREQFDYNKELNELQMQREDTTYQRTIEDLQKAGLNPNLLLGGSAGALSASAGSPVSGVMPTGKGGISDLIGLFNMVQSAKEVDARVKNLEAGANAYNQKATGDTISNQMKQIELSKYDLMLASRLLKMNSETARNEGAALLSKAIATLNNQEYLGHEADGTYRNIPMISEYTSGGALGVHGSHSSTVPFHTKANQAPSVVNHWYSLNAQEQANVRSYENYIRNKGYDVNTMNNAKVLIDMRNRAKKLSSFKDFELLLDDYKDLF